ncbi:LysR substrate-binding domain-containing protein [Aeromicrobium sp. UC242_57]|uniref:LysR substrate-binding domain-containing protein n=1 Tax=Aeromicrobium sp. UC242_57 TaxID=3374624 RepID=UPI0037B23B27
MASPAFIARWFSQGVDATSLAQAPVIVFDRSDVLQDEYLTSVSDEGLQPPRHHVPASAEFAAAVRLGLGWGMLPRQQSSDAEAAGDLVALDAGAGIDVHLYWQQWTLRTPALVAVEEAIRAAAAEHLDTVKTSRP